MGLVQKIGNLLKPATSSNSSLYQAIRCMSSSKLFVGGISYGTDDQSLREAFANYGEVIEARVIMDRETGRSRGFGFVTYTSTEEAAAAITGLDGKDLQGRIVRVNYAHDRGSRAGAYGGGGGGGGYGSGGYGGGYAGGGGYGGGAYGGGGGYNASGNYGFAEGGRGGYSSGGGYAGGNGGYSGGSPSNAGSGGGYNAAPGNYSGENNNQGGGLPGAYGGGNYGTSNDSCVNSASHGTSACNIGQFTSGTNQQAGSGHTYGKLDDFLDDLKVDDGKDKGEGEGYGLVSEEFKGLDGQEDLLEDDLKDDFKDDEDEPDDYANKRS